MAALEALRAYLKQSLLYITYIVRTYAHGAPGPPAKAPVPPRGRIPPHPSTRRPSISAQDARRAIFSPRRVSHNVLLPFRPLLHGGGSPALNVRFAERRLRVRHSCGSRNPVPGPELRPWYRREGYARTGVTIRSPAVSSTNGAVLTNGLGRLLWDLRRDLQYEPGDLP